MASAENVQQSWLVHDTERFGQGSGAVSVAIDPSGDVIATGTFGGFVQWYTAKYSGATGAKIWETIYTGFNHAFARQVVVDSTGNAIVSGVTTDINGTQYIHTEKYAASDGQLVWSQTVPGQGLFGGVGVDAQGHVIVAGTTSTLYAVKYDATGGDILWEGYANGGNGGGGRALAVTPSGDAVVTGFLRPSFGHQYTYTVKFDGTDGSTLWGVSGTGSAGKAVKVDAQGNVAIAGSVAIVDGFDTHLARYSGSDGSLIWEKVSTQSTQNSFVGEALDVDPAGNVVIATNYTALSNDFGTFDGIYTAKYAAADGALLWQRNYSGPVGPAVHHHYNLSVKLGASGHVFVSGQENRIEDGVATHESIYTAKYDGTDGAVLWEQRYDGPTQGGAETSRPFQLAPTPDGGAAVGVSSLGFLGADRVTYFTVIKYGIVQAALPDPADFFITTGEMGDPWTFTATLDADEPGLFLRVQSTLTPDEEGSWTDLPGGGQMTRQPEGDGNTWTLETSEIPLGKRYFRVIAAADGFADSKLPFPNADNPIAFNVSSPAGRILFTRGDFLEQQLVLMEADGSGKTTLADEAFSPQQCALSPGGHFAAFTTMDGALYVMQAQPADDIENVPVNILDDSGVFAAFSSSLTWAPDGRHIAFAGSDSSVWVIKAVDALGNITPHDHASNPLIAVAETFSGAPNPAWSPDGRHLALMGGNYIEVFEVMDSAGAITPQSGANPFIAITDPGDFSSAKVSAAWSPDGQWLAFVERTPDGMESRISLLHARDAAGDLTPEEEVLNPSIALHDFTGDPQAESVSWSPDGSLLAIGANNGPYYHIETIFPEEISETNPRVPLTDPEMEGNAFGPAFWQNLNAPHVLLPSIESFVVDPPETGSAWVFTAFLDSDAPGLFLRVQSTLTPDEEGSWTDMPGGGHMSQSGNAWTLETAVVPIGLRYFRVIAAASGFHDSKLADATAFQVVSPAGRILFTRGNILDRELVIMEADGSSKTVLAGSHLKPLQCALSVDGGHVAFTTVNDKLYVMRAEPASDDNPPVNILEAAVVEPMFGSAITWSPFGPHLAFAGSDSRIYVIEVLDDNGDIHPYNDTSVPLIDVGGSLSGAPNPAWSPNGRYLALLGSSQVQLLEVADSNGNITAQGATNQPIPLTLAEFSSAKTYAAWAPDGETIAFVETSPGGGESRVSLLTAFDAFGELTPETPEGGANPRIPLHAMTASPQAQTVSWSPDGSLLALGVEAGGDYWIELIKPETVDPDNPRIPLTSIGADGHAFQPSFRQPAAEQTLQPPVIAFQAPLYAGNEDGDPIVVRVVRTGSASDELEVAFAVTGGTADEGLDYSLSDSPLVFAPGQQEAHIIVTALADGLDDEGDETIELELLSTSAGELGEQTTTLITINDSDSNQQPFTPAAAELTVAVNGKILKKGNAKTGDRFAFTVRQDLGMLLPGLEVKVQVTTTPNIPGSWVHVPDLKLSRPTKTSLTWKGSVPASKLPSGTLYFRTRSYAAAHRSNAGPVAGPFKVTPAPVLVLVTTAVTDSDQSGMTVKPGEFITYKLDCYNIGAAVAKKVVLNSIIPAQTRLDSASHDSGSFPGYFVRVTGAKGKLTDVRWNVGDIQPGSQASEFVTVQVNQEVEFAHLIQNARLTYKMTGSKETFTPILRTTIESPLIITVSKDKNIVVAGDLITYTLAIRNDASYPITGGKVNNEVPKGTRLYTAAQGDGAGNYLGAALVPAQLNATPDALSRPGYTAHDRMLVWNVGSIAPGGTRHLRFTVRVAYDLFEKIARNGESYNTEIQNLNFDFTGTPPGGGIIAARGGVIPGNQIARSLVSQEDPPLRPELGLVKKAVSDSLAAINNKDIAAVYEDGTRVIEYQIRASNYGNITAEDTVIYDALPLNTDFDMDVVVSGRADTDVVTTDEPHGFAANERIVFTSLQEGAGLKTNVLYFVREVLSVFEFTISTQASGAPVDLKSDLLLGGVRRASYDWARFMSRFSLDGAPFDFPSNFTFFDEKGQELSAGGEPYVDTNGNGKVDKGEFIDQNGNGKYDGPWAVRSFEYRMGHLPPMTAPNARLLAYRAKVRPQVKTGTLVTALSSDMHIRSQGLELISPDFIYPLFGKPSPLNTKVIRRLNWKIDDPQSRGVHYIANKPETHSITYAIRIQNTGDLYARGTTLRVPIPQAFQIGSQDGFNDTFNSKHDAKLAKSPGTWVVNIGEVAPGQELTREITCTFQPPLPAAWLDKDGFLLTKNIPILPKVVSTHISNRPEQSGATGLAREAKNELAPQFVAKFDASGGSATIVPVMKGDTDPRCFIGRITPAAVQAGTETDIYIIYGNHGGVRTDSGEIGMQIPFGTSFVSAEPVCFNPLDGGLTHTGEYPRDYFKIVPVAAKRQRPQDGNIGTVFFRFGNTAPGEIGVVKVRLFVTSDFPGSFLTDTSLYINYRGVAGKSPAPMSIQVLRNTNGATDWWQSTVNFLDKVGSEVNTALRNFFGAGNNGEFRLGRQMVTLGGADFVHLANGSVIIPLGRSRSAIISRYDELVQRVPHQSLMLWGEVGAEGLGLAAGVTSQQQVFVPGSISANRNVQDILAQLTSPASIVAAGGGNIVAGGGGNIVAAGGGNIVAGGGGNVVSNDGAGLLPGGITFSIPGINPGIVAAGGGNIVAAGGGNIVAAGGGNIVAAGGGNIVAAGGGNLVLIDGTKIDPNKMSSLISKLAVFDGANLLDPQILKLIGLDGASVVANDGAGLIGLDGASLVGQDGAGFQ